MVSYYLLRIVQDDIDGLQYAESSKIKVNSNYTTHTTPVHDNCTNIRVCIIIVIVHTTYMKRKELCFLFFCWDISHMVLTKVASDF